MDPAEKSEATRLLARLCAGQETAGAELLPLIYGELHAIAARAMERERTAHTLQPTALVSEAWMRLSAGALPEVDSRSEFLGIAARAMRQVLVDHARKRDAKKRGEGARPEPLDHVLAAYEERSQDVIDVDTALAELSRVDPELAKVVELRFFGGLSVDDVAAACGVSKSTAERQWRLARMWLREALEE